MRMLRRGASCFGICFCMLPQHIANIIIVLLLLERQTCACVELAMVWACFPILDTLRPPQIWATRRQVTDADPNASLTAGARPDG